LNYRLRIWNIYAIWDLPDGAQSGDDYAAMDKRDRRMPAPRSSG
jgi:hypothetical protein